MQAASNNNTNPSEINLKTLSGEVNVNIPEYHKIMSEIGNQIEAIKNKSSVDPNIVLMNGKTYQQMMIWHKHIFGRDESSGLYPSLCPIKQRFNLFVVPVLYIPEGDVVVVIPVGSLK
jgi:hypothetical protein